MAIYSNNKPNSDHFYEFMTFNLNNKITTNKISKIDKVNTYSFTRNTSFCSIDSEYVCRIGGTIAGMNDAPNILWSYKTEKIYKIPVCNIRRSYNYTVYSKKRGLITVGGYNHFVNDIGSFEIIKPIKNKNNIISFENQKWKTVEMDRKASNLSCTLVNNDNALIMVGGFDRYYKSSCSIYNFDKNITKSIANYPYSVGKCGIIEWKQYDSVVCVGGRSRSNSVCQYDMNRDEWFNLPSTKYRYDNHPNVSIQYDLPFIYSNSGIFVVMNSWQNNKTSQNMIEYYDPRDSTNAWHALNACSYYMKSKNNIPCPTALLSFPL